MEGQRLVIGISLDPVASVLCLGAHPDDIEIGAFGLVDRLAKRNPTARFDFVVLTGDESRIAEAKESMHSLVGERGTLHAGGFRDGALPYKDPLGVKDFLGDAVSAAGVDVVIAPHESDRHQDHAFAAHLVDQLYRDHWVVGYEIPKFDADLQRPGLFVSLTTEEANAKVDHLLTHFNSQRAKPWYTEEVFRALMGLRGIECKSPSGYAEAFHVSKLLLV